MSDNRPLAGMTALVTGASGGIGSASAELLLRDGATVVAVYSPRVRPGVPVSFPVPWDELDQVSPADFTVHTAAALTGGGDPWAAQLPAPQALPASLTEEGRAIPIARVQAMHEGKRRARARRDAADEGARDR